MSPPDSTIVVGAVELDGKNVRADVRIYGHSVDVAQLNIDVRRAAIHCYPTAEELDALAGVLRRAAERLRELQPPPILSAELFEAAIQQTGGSDAAAERTRQEGPDAR